MVTAGLALFGVSVVAQGVQWVHNAWAQQDWIAMGGGVAGGLIVFAGVGSVVTEWRRCIGCVSARRSATWRASCCTATGWGKGANSARSWRARPGWIRGIRRCSAGRPRCMKRKRS